MGGHRQIGKPKLRWSDVIRKDIKEKQLNIEEAQYRITWRVKTRCADPKYGKMSKTENTANYGERLTVLYPV